MLLVQMSLLVSYSDHHYWYLLENHKDYPTGLDSDLIPPFSDYPFSLKSS